MPDLLYRFRAPIWPALVVVLDDALAFDERLTDAEVQQSAARLGVDVAALAPLEGSQVPDPLEGSG